ncbi:hypothetical protein BOW53_10285 [Solemya pervernicosa gill symbiont]|uniref:Glycosyltransferase 2-like domain-containing protein n=2 Tax=Gammaproteobacteria incertae sedis TaxID=118884 RepID=A0A1T2L3V0_9GAMM|nr:glycosyltransferase family 2 protein [Candidatus Reidiella endopervernicosa]OOZ39754.1 hypothetical protein BOW53_10285 [Solemya pervernicosa gill symbiont]QKQ27909.1 glycosyltransferase [Candidatus Reidiella endopervernicosa]
MKLVITVCTRERETLLANCMASILELVIPDGVSLAVVVVENDIEPRNSDAIERLGAESEIEFHYVHESRIGIPIARNRACDEAIKISADWIAFIDDDEQLTPTWLVKMVAAMGTHPADVYTGPVEPQIDVEMSEWMAPRTRKHRPTGLSLETAATNNTLLSAEILQRFGEKLRFDEVMRYTGGSDTRFFYQLTDMGGTICWVDDAVVEERFGKERVTYRWHLQRSLRCGAHDVYIHTMRRGRLATIKKYLFKVLRRLPRGIVMILMAPLLRLKYSREEVGRWVLNALKLIASSTGTLLAFFGVNPAPYKRVKDGDR